MESGLGKHPLLGRITDLLGNILILTDDHSVLINLERLGRRLDQFVHLQMFIMLFNEKKY